MNCKIGVFVNVFFRNLVQLHHAVMFVFKLVGNDTYPAYLKVSIPMMENVLFFRFLMQIQLLNFTREKDLDTLYNIYIYIFR